jgi:hypothetical protein
VRKGIVIVCCMVLAYSLRCVDADRTMSISVEAFLENETY